jgi:putative aldouronate transport system substrate-binding protein
MDTAAVVAGWAAAPAWESKGYYPVSFGEFQPTLTYSNPFGKIGVAVSAKAENVDASLKLVDMLSDPEALITLYNGPQGDRWDIADNKLVFTDKFKQYRANGGGTYTLNNGEEFALYNFVTYIRGTGNIIEKYNEPFPMTLWKQYLEEQYSSDTAKAWSARYGYKYLKEQLEAEDRLKGVMDPSFPAFLTPDSDDLKLSLAALKDVIVPGTWELVYAKDEAEFEKVWQTLKTKSETLGIQSIIDFKLDDIAKAKETAKQFK